MLLSDRNTGNLQADHRSNLYDVSFNLDTLLKFIYTSIYVFGASFLLFEDRNVTFQILPTLIPTDYTSSKSSFVWL